MGLPDDAAAASGDPQPFVRQARLVDAEAFAAVQHRSWVRGAEHVALPPPPPREDMQRAWERAITVPPSSRHHSFVAVDRSSDGEVVRGIAASTPASDPDLDAERCVEVVVLAVEPDARGRGHGSRLVTALVDVAVDEGAEEAVTWVAVDDDATRQFLEGCGWAADGAFRTLSTDDPDQAHGSELRQVRLATALVDADASDQGTR